MGNQPANDLNLFITNQERDEWIKLQDQGYCQLWANKKTNKRYQAYPISQAVAKDNVQIEKYAFRKMHNSFLVAAEALISQNQTFLCSVPSTSFVLIQNIVSRLKSYQNTLTFEEALYVLSSSASGYNTLCSFFGPLEPNQDMICLNDSGNVKVWLNENLSKNQASLNARSMELEMPKMDDINFAQRRSRQCVEKLMKIVQNSCIQPFPKAFKEQAKKLSTFFEISNFVDFFCVQNNIRILDHIELRKTPTFVSDPSQANLYSSGGAVPVRVQVVPSLQSSRVNKVFHSNFNQRQPLSPLFIPPAQQSIQNVQFRPPLYPPVSLPLIQSHQVSYKVSPPVQTHVVVPPQIVIQPAIVSPPPLQTVQLNTTVKRNEITPEQSMQKTIIEQQKIESKLSQVISTPEKPQKVVLQQEGSLHKKELSEHYQEKPQFNQEQIDYYHNQKQVDHQNNQKHAENHAVINEQPIKNAQEPEAQPYQSQAVHQIQQNEYQEQQNYENYHEEREPNANSVYSNIEQYVPPQQQHAFIESIQEKRQEYIISPRKQSEIDEWSQKLDNFTNSKSKNAQTYKTQAPKVQQNELIVQTKQPESFKNLIVSDKKQEYVNELVNLQSDDIESYIRMKYQSYLKEQTQPETQSKPIQYRRQSQQEVYRPKYESYRSNQYPTQQQTAYNEYYPKSSYQYKSPLIGQTNQNFSRNEQNQYQYTYQNSSIPSNTNRISIEKEFTQDYPSQRNYEPSSYAYRYKDQIENNYTNQQQKPYPPRRDLERRASNRTSNIMQEKYSKYVLNSQKPKRQSHNVHTEDVSLILPCEQSNFIKKTPRPIAEKSFEHDSFSQNRASVNKGITYQKLRNLLRDD